jgi:hypothetical protein
MKARMAVALGAWCTASMVWAAPQTVTLQCEAVYQPARSTWTRVVDIDMDDRRILAVRIDGVPVYTFAVRDTWILTALDNERIQIDAAAGQWRSDFRGLAQSQGRCERQPA